MVNSWCGGFIGKFLLFSEAGLFVIQQACSLEIEFFVMTLSYLSMVQEFFEGC